MLLATSPLQFPSASAIFSHPCAFIPNSTQQGLRCHATLVFLVLVDVGLCMDRFEETLDYLEDFFLRGKGYIPHFKSKRFRL
jgi:hypothetical protein